MRHFGLIGYPLGHSFSQRYFSAKFEREGIRDCTYHLFPIPSIDGFSGLWETYPDLVGINVTIPYKEQVMMFLDHCSMVVAESGACNCVKRTSAGLTGYNTDVVGFERTLEPGLQPWHERALILGTGGAAKAVAYVLRRKGIGYRFVSRYPGGEDTLSYEMVDGGILSDHHLIINTTPLGMSPQVDAMPDLPYHLLGTRHYLFDLVYNPSETAFLREGVARGARVCNGADMLVIQAEESWRIWNDPEL
ncbi:MAG: shikimate dehydrogenase family protein [Chitinophagaceae bacterium]|jgi:shikimate dehydrogenase